MNERSDRVVVVVGAGFCGAVVAARLLGHGAGGRTLRILIADKSGRMGRGLAYGTRSEQHVLNVPVGRMSALEDDPDDFLRFAQRQDTGITAGSFVSRQLYGEYLEEVLERAVRAAAPGVTLERRVCDVTHVAPTADGAGATLTMEGERVTADRVVLAVGNYAPAHPPLRDRRFVDSPAYVADPWLPGALEAVRRDRPVLLVGTGLTMLDIALELRSRGRTAPMIAVSRRGLLPQAHRGHGAAPHAIAVPPDLLAHATSLDQLRTVRAWIHELAESGVDWRDALVALRPITAALWHRLDRRERGRFLRHVRPFWEVHRHRAAPRPAALLDRMIEDRELEPVAARLVALDPDDEGFRVSLRRRGQAEVSSLEVAAVVNCTGPCTDVRTLDDPLVAALREQGLLRPDAHGLGVEVDERAALVGADGRPSAAFAVVGPLLRARDWEATAVPELRAVAHRVAARLADELAAP